MMKKTTKKVICGVAALAGVMIAGVKIASNIQKKQCREDSKNPFEGKKVIFVENEEDPENADGVRGHLEPVSASAYTPSFYDKYVKRGLDIVLSFGGLRYYWEPPLPLKLMTPVLYFLPRRDWDRIRNTSVYISSAV